ncbi:hypothetical protein M408DRAFT_333455 [Serendipita vermifera MAFF 305830]|uniref:Uncharacterized protein n=1 Tax=Serendipita vermifera MAFF 305830 TaxID=933852 RepID=A0A0C3AN31_SERVB|nr:hypothetical protein M408DRAFT_333455 [Serendipita vermifera MAFF 305830]
MSVTGTSDSFFPSSEWPPRNPVVVSHPPAEGYELECLLRLKDTYKELLSVSKVAIGRLKEWLPQWDSHYDQLDGVFTDEDFMLNLLKRDLQREQLRLLQAESEQKSWEQSLPHEGLGHRGSKTTAYRQEKAASLIKDIEAYASNVESLKARIAEQETEVKAHHQQVLPSLTVVNFAHSSFNVLTSIEETLSQEYTAIVARMVRPIDNVSSETWIKIFEFAVELQDDANREVLFTGLPLDEIKSPRQTALAIAGVCQKWRRIAHSEEAGMLWPNILIEATNMEERSLSRPLFPHPNAAIPNAVSVNVVTRQPDNMNVQYPPILRWIRGLDVANLGLVYQNTPLPKVHELLEVITGKDSFNGLSIMCRDTPVSGQVVIPSKILGAVTYLELVDLQLNLASFHLPSPAVQMNELTYLHLRYTVAPEVHHRLSPSFLYQLVTKAPMLKHLEVDLGFEDIPLLWNKPHFPPFEGTLAHLRSLTTRLSYFQNRLSFLPQLPLPSLESISLVKMTSYASSLTWDGLSELLQAGGGLGNRIKHFEVSDLIPRAAGMRLIDACFITEKLPNIQTLTLRHGAVEHFIQGALDGKFPLSGIRLLSLWDSSITDNILLEFVRIYHTSDSAGQPPSSGQIMTAIGSNPEIGRKHVEIYRCPNISSNALDNIARILRGYGPMWIMAAQPE